MVWLEAKVLPLATATVMVELSPSSISVGCAETVHVASSLSAMVTVVGADGLPAVGTLSLSPSRRPQRWRRRWR